MVNTRSGSGVDQPAVNRLRRAPRQAQMDPAMQQFLEAQTQLLQNVDINLAMDLDSCYPQSLAQVYGVIQEIGIWIWGC
jgi:hypothetical protein